MQNANKTGARVEKKVINYMLSGKVIIIPLIAEYIKKILLNKMSYYPETDSHNRNKITVELDMYNTSELPKKKLI